jgi:hypothetical protein
MSQFYVSFIFIGIALVVFSLTLILLDKKKAFNFLKNYEEKKQELIDIINDAEQMIEELNKFSDYIVTQMDFKNEELSNNLKKADEQLGNLAQKAQELYSNETLNKETVKEVEIKSRNDTKKETSFNVNSNSKDAVEKYKESLLMHNNRISLDSNDLESIYDTNWQTQKTMINMNEKVIPVNSRHNEVMRLYKSGLSEIEIAKKLGMGKGEVQLIIEVNK